MDDIHKIINGYAGLGADAEKMGILYDFILQNGIDNATRALLKEKEEYKNIHKRILTIIAGKKEKERSVFDDVRKYIFNIIGQFSTAQLYGELCISNKQEKESVRQALHRLVSLGEIQKIGERSGLYTRLETKYTVYKLDGIVEEPLNFRMPLNIHDLGAVCGGDIISVWGEKSTGKSAFGLYTTWLNKDLFPGHKVRYIQNGELKPRRLTRRLMKWPQQEYPFSTWNDKVDFINPESAHWADIVDPDGLNVIDYIERLTDAFLIPEDISRIQAKMNKGVALVMVQKDPGKVFGAGGAQLKNKPTIIVSLQRDTHFSKAEIIDIKDYDDKAIHRDYSVGSPTGLWRPYKLVGGWKFLPQDDWLRRGDEKYKGYESKSKKKEAPEDDIFVKGE